MRLVFATHNQGKIKEMRAILAGLALEILGMDDVGIFEDVVEDGKTFEENALKKVKFVLEKCKDIGCPKGHPMSIQPWIVADDSGLCIRALGGDPGVYSARWAGEEASGEEIVRFTLEKLKDVPEGKREAHFECVLALVSPAGETWFFHGRVHGAIALKPRGAPHPKLPYDAIFIPNGYETTFAEMPLDDKNRLSHRGMAFRKLREFFEEMK